MSSKNGIPHRGSLSEGFEQLLRGKLKALIDYVASDSDLDLQVRDNSFTIYVDGGKAMEVDEEGKFSFNQWYFYKGSYQGVKIAKTYIEEQAKGSNKRKKIPKGYPSRELAQQIVKEIKEEFEGLMAKARRNDFKSYFQIAKPLVCEWVNAKGKKERRDQHYIACSNRSFSENNDLVVIDIEFAVSTRKPYNETKNDKEKPKGPRFDIIAVDRQGQLYSIELKNNLRADKEGAPQNVEHHLKDFNDSISKAVSESDFPQEMSEVVALKKKLGILGEDVFVDESQSPKFAIAYSGKDENDKAKFKERHPDLMLVNIIKVGEKKLYLKL